MEVSYFILQFCEKMAPAKDVSSFNSFEKFLTTPGAVDEFKKLRQGVTQAKSGSSRAISRWNLNLARLEYDKETSEKQRATSYLKDMNTAIDELTAWKGKLCLAYDNISAYMDSKSEAKEEDKVEIFDNIHADII